MRSLWLVTTALLTGLLTHAVTEPPDKKPPKKPPASRRTVDQFEAVRALRIEVSEIKMQDLPLDEFTQWLGRQSGVNVVPRWEALSRAGVERDELITLQLKNVTL